MHGWQSLKKCTKCDNYEEKHGMKSLSLLQLIKIICEELIPYYSSHCSDKPIMRYRVATLKNKSEANTLATNRFHQPLDTDFIFYFSSDQIYAINPHLKTCTCRWNLAYGCCKHIYK
jgi:hypothetical protein